tara:strand:+ start:138 stop:653 length:516 start_codon:yes stop_codon:yes gene_type:complete
MKNFLIIIVLLFFTTAIAKAEQKIVYIDLEKILSKTIAGNQLSNQVKSLSNKNLKDLEVIEKGLQEDEKQLVAQQNILSPEEMNKKVITLKKKINEYKKKRTKKIQELNKIQIDNTNKLMNMINPLLTKYADKNSISIILHQKSVIIGRSELDVTEEIITIVNNNIKKFQI